MKSIFALVPLLVLALHGEPSGDGTQRGAKEIFNSFGDQGVMAIKPPQPKPVSPLPAPTSDPLPQGTPPAIPASSQPLGLRYWIELVEAPGSTGRRVTEQRDFRTGEKIRFHFTSNRDGYLNIAQVGSSGRTTVLFPAPQQGLNDNFLPTHVERTFPGPDHWLRFDDQPGTEDLLFILASTREDLDAVVAAFLSLLNKEQVVQLAQSGGKDLLLEREETSHSEFGTYVVDERGAPIVVQVRLNQQ